MGSSKMRWKLSFRRSASASPSTSASTSPTPSFTADMPVEFLCPISRSIMADPVIIPSGRTFERSCIQACIDLAFAPPDLHLSFTSPLLLISNSALKSAIFFWCHRCGLPPPLGIPTEAAVALVRRLMPQDNPPFLAGATAPFEDGKDEKEDVHGGGKKEGEEYGPSEFVRESKDDKDGILPSVAEDESNETMISTTIPPLSEREREKDKSSSFSSVSTPSSGSYHSSSSSYSFSEIIVADEKITRDRSPRVTDSPSRSKADPLEEMLIKLKDFEGADAESTAASLRQATRENRDRRIALCTPRLLGALHPLLLSPCAAIQIDTAAAIVNLSVEPVNKIKLLRSGMVPALVEVLKRGPEEARYHAAGVIFGLAIENENRAAIGVLGAIPPLLELFTRSSGDGGRARGDAGMALYHLSLVAANRSKIARTPGAVRALLSVSMETEEPAPASCEQGQSPGLARIAMMVIHNLAGCNEGRAALMDAGAVSALAALLTGLPLEAAVVEHCVATLYWMSQGSLRFRGLAKAAGVEQQLARVAAEEGEGTRQELARRVLRAMRGDRGHEAAKLLSLGLEEEEAYGDCDSAVSDGLVSLRRRRNDFAKRAGGVSSAKFCLGT